MVQPWHEKANAEFVTLFDSQNILGNSYNLKAIPYGVMIDEAGRMVKSPFNINVAKKETIAMLEKWLSDPTYNATLLRNLKPLSKSPNTCLLYTSPSPRDRTRSRMPSSA